MVTKRPQYEMVLRAIMLELETAEKSFPALNSLHEGYAVILEELDEAWDEIKVKQKNRSRVMIERELIQTAAMCVRTIVDVLGKD